MRLRMGAHPAGERRERVRFDVPQSRESRHIHHTGHPHDHQAESIDAIFRGYVAECSAGNSQGVTRLSGRQPAGNRPA